MGLAMINFEIEERAKEIYETWKDQEGYLPWVEGGNSLKQDEARRIAQRESYQEQLRTI